jgi:hypothetical protein
MIHFALIKPKKPLDRFPGDEREPAGVFMIQFPGTEVTEYLNGLPDGSYHQLARMSFSLVYLYDEADVYGFRMAMTSYKFLP